MAETRILVEGGLVYDHDGDTDRPAARDILIEGARIARVEPGLRAALAGGPPPDRAIDARRRLVVPGFVNAHYHSHDVLLKGIFEPMPLQMWFVNALPPQYPMRSAEEVRARTLLGAAECLLAGITTVQDMATLYPFDDALLDAVLQAYDEIGIRTVFSLQIGDRRAVDRIPHWRELVPEDYHDWLGSPIGVGGEPPLETVRRQIERIGLERERFSWALGPTSAIMSSPELLSGIAALSERHGLPVLSHMYESRPEVIASRTHLGAHGGSQIDYMRACGLLGPRLALAHSIWFTRDEIDALAEAGGRVVLNPASNMKSKSGVAPIRHYREAGVGIALGCDNCACSDVQNMFQAMKLFCGLAAISEIGLETPDAAEALRAATLGGAAAIGLSGEVGAIAPGMRADLCLYDLDRPTLLPLNSAARQMVYTETGSALDTVIVEGRVTVEGGRLTTIDADMLRESVEAVIGGLRADQRAVAARFETLRPYLAEAWHRSWETDIGMERYVGAPGRSG